jgi:hypothetical protein
LFGDGDVANSAVVTWDKKGNKPSPCIWRNDSQKQACFEDALNNVTEAILRDSAGKAADATTTVWPALGVGNGGQEPKLFYDILARHIRYALADRKSPWNCRILLLAWRSETNWLKERTAIANSFGDLAERWELEGPNESASDLAFMAGIAGTLALFLFLIVFGTQRLPGGISRDLLLTVGPWWTTVAYFAACAGLLAIATQMVKLAGFDHVPLWVYAVLGCASVPLCYPLARISDAVKEAQTGQARSSGPPATK